ncbi:MAG: 5-(carboxyamino)imidazole ribonucleotide mutase [Planctomycetes bacterium]|nr:5-(carboxyamino)imidazole ribonucleotide mutase [Planctomycetota bacterium]
MGSESDFPVMKPCMEILRHFSVPFEARICSAHRTPSALTALLRRAEEEGCRVIVAGAGAAAHLAGVCAAHTALPVIGVPIESSSLQGLDALLSTVMMPGGVPVAAMGIGKAGAKNAGLFATQLLAIADPALVARLRSYRQSTGESVLRQDSKLQENLARLLEEEA